MLVAIQWPLKRAPLLPGSVWYGDLEAHWSYLCCDGPWSQSFMIHFLQDTMNTFSLCFSLKHYLKQTFAFYTPVWKMGRIMPWQCPSVRPSVCPSVRPSLRPSVRPRFPDFSSTCFEISIWNLVYAFSRWHDMSSLSCITIGSIWHSLQPKVGQTYFLQSWPHKSRGILQIWYTGGLLYTSRHKFRFL